MKVVSALRKRCKDCKINRRGKKVYIRCETFPRHKQRQGFCTWTPMTFSSPVDIQNFQISGRELLVLNNLCSTVFRY